MAWIIFFLTSQYASGILISVDGGVKIVSKKIEVLSYMIVSDYVIIKYQAREA